MQTQPIKRFQLPDNGKTINIGDGSATSFMITHPLNTKDIHVDIFRNANGKKVSADVQVSDANNVSISFAEPPATDQYKILILRK